MRIKKIRRKLFSMILPIIIENILQLSAGLISMAMIGRISPVAVSAQGLCIRITEILWCFFKGIAIGATVFVARAYGANDLKKLRKVVQQTLLSSIALVIFFQQIIYWRADFFLGFFNPQTNLLENSLVYLKTIVWGLPFVVIMIVVTGTLQGMGNAKTPMIIALIMNLVNIVLNYVLIYGKLGFASMGLKGAAISLIIAQFIGAALGLYTLFRKQGVLYSLRNRSFFKIDFLEIKEVFNAGIPASFESMFWEFAAIILSKVILSFGEVPFAAYQLGIQAESISEMPAIGFGVAATTFISQSLGDNNKKLGKTYLQEIVKGSFLISIMGSALLLFFPGVLMKLLTNNQEVIKLGIIYLTLMGLIQIPQNLSRVFNGALRGAGYTKIPMIVAGIGLWGIRVPFSMILTYYFKTEVVVIWVLICIDQTFRFILSYILYKKKDIYGEKLPQKNMAKSAELLK